MEKSMYTYMVRINGEPLHESIVVQSTSEHAAESCARAKAMKQFADRYKASKDTLSVELKSVL